MKSINVSMKAVITSMAFLFATVASVPAIAGNPGTEDPSGVQVKFLGSLNEQNLFEVNVTNKNSEVYIITLKTAKGETLYTERFSEKAYNKKFLLENDLDNEPLVVIVSSVKGKTEERYALNTSVQTTSHLEIRKIK